MRICLIGAANLSNNPRLLREADLLSQQHEVRVVCQGTSRASAEADARLLARRSWRLQRVDHPRADWMPSEIFRSHWLQSVLVRGRRRLAEEAFRYIKSAGLAEYSVCASRSELEKLACSERADWFIAHTQPALPAAAAAARKWEARLGFDCEDLLAETGDKFCEANRLIERKYLPQCDSITATSNAMAENLANAYSIPRPVVLYNVFPLSLVEGIVPPAQRRAHSKLRLYWVSQTIGPDRGIQDAFQACAGLTDHIEIHLRGRLSEPHKRELIASAEQWGVAGCINLHPVIHRDELFRSMAEYDVGLALERPQNRNHGLTASNKIFSYLLVGLAVAATDTPGQHEVMEHSPGAGFLYTSGDTKCLRAALECWIGDREQLWQAQQAAWDVARSRFCWDIEQKTFLELLNRSA
ncbi:MAG TPA: glycosyltransferase [Terriglobales bacterium]|nr:glycosyltransferase [Terriglobales bacterium]